LLSQQATSAINF